MRKQVKCLSGLTGEQQKLRNIYSNMAEFSEYAAMYDIHGRLGYKSPATAWQANPTIQSSVNPGDLCRVDRLGRRHQCKDANWGAGDYCRKDSTGRYVHEPRLADADKRNREQEKAVK
jgi:hypothetical protein